MFTQKLINVSIWYHIGYIYLKKESLWHINWDNYVLLQGFGKFTIDRKCSGPLTTYFRVKGSGHVLPNAELLMMTYFV